MSDRNPIAHRLILKIFFLRRCICFHDEKTVMLQYNLPKYKGEVSMTVDFKSIWNSVKANRIQQRMTQAELAEKTGMSDVYISRIETGARSPSLTSLIKIVYILDISLDSLVLDDSATRLPVGYREFWELLADCDMSERSKILKTASAYKKVVREGQK